MTEQQARQLAEEAIEYADTEGHFLGGTIVVGIDLAGKFWVADNGEEVNGLTEQGAIEIIVENLTSDKE